MSSLYYTIYDLLILLYNITLRVSDYWATFLSPHILPNMSGNSHCESYHWEFILRYIQKHLIIQTINTGQYSTVQYSVASYG